MGSITQLSGGEFKRTVMTRIPPCWLKQQLNTKIHTNKEFYNSTIRSKICECSALLRSKGLEQTWWLHVCNRHPRCGADAPYKAERRRCRIERKPRRPRQQHRQLTAPAIAILLSPSMSHYVETRDRTTAPRRCKSEPESTWHRRKLLSSQALHCLQREPEQQQSSVLNILKRWAEMARRDQVSLTFCHTTPTLRE